MRAAPATVAVHGVRSARGRRPGSRGSRIVPRGARGPDRRLLDSARGRGGARPRGRATRRAARLRRERGGDARDGRDHRAGAVRRAADAGAERPDARAAARARRGLLAAAPRVRAGAAAAQRGHHGVLHLGDRRRAGRLRGHLRRARPPRGRRGGHRGRAGADARGPARVGRVREHGAGAGVPAWAADVGVGSRHPPPRLGHATARGRFSPGSVRSARGDNRGGHRLRAAAREHRVGAAGGRRRLARVRVARVARGADAAARRPGVRGDPRRWRLRVRPGRRARTGHRAAARLACGAARARGHLAAGGGGSGGAARGFPPRPRPPPPGAVRDRGRRDPRRDRLRGAARGGRPVAGGAPLRIREAPARAGGGGAGLGDPRGELRPGGRCARARPPAAPPARRGLGTDGVRPAARGRVPRVWSDYATELVAPGCGKLGASTS